MAEFGWAYINCGNVLSGAGGPEGAVQYKTSTGIDGQAGFIYDTGSNRVAIGVDWPDLDGTTIPNATLHVNGDVSVTGTIYATAYQIENITSLSASGDSKFGDSAGDIHEFTGSVRILGNLSASNGMQITDHVQHNNGLSNFNGNRVTFNSDVTASNGLLIPDDTLLRFGTSAGDATIEYDENGTDELRFAGAAVTFEQAVTFDANVTLGDAASDVATVTGQLTASNGAYIAGNVGIGTNSPSGMLEVVAGSDANGTIAVRSGNASQYSKISMGTNANKATIGCPGADDTFFTDTAAGDLVLRADDNNNKVHLGAGTSGIAAMVITEVSNVGKVGIGTAVPGVPLEVLDPTASSATQGGNLRLSSNDGAAMGSGHRLGVLEFAGAEDTGGSITVGARIEALCDAAWSGTENGADLLFYTTDGNASQSERMRILATGRVGIGDSSPDALLDIQGAADTGVPTLLVDHDDVDVIAVDINAANTTANAVDIDADAVTTAKAVNISADALTSGNAIRIGDNSSDTTSRQTALIVQNNAAATGATALHVQSDGGNTGMAIDKNASGTAAQNATALHIDFDRTVPGSGTNAHNDVGIDLDVDSRSLGTSTVKGMDIDVTGHTDGTSTAKGMDITVTGADTNIGMLLTVADGGTDIKLNSSADSGDYFKIETTTHGATTITTADNSATAADLTFTIDGDIILGPAGGDVLPDGDNTRNLGSAAKRWANIYTGDLHLKNDRGDWTIVEEEDFLCVINNRTGKKFKMNLIPLEDDE